MRLTLRLEDDLYGVARAMAKDLDISISDAVNRLLRRALEPAPRKPRRDRTGLPVVPCKRTFTSEDVAQFEAENA